MKISKESICLNIANLLPARIKLWCFILVYGEDGLGPCEVYKQKYEYFNKKHKLNM